MDRRVAVTLARLTDEWQKEHRLADLAAAVNLAPSRLQHLFKDAVAMSIGEHLRNRRLREAARLIATTHERISEIAYSVGFRDVSNFNHAFRRAFGLSPREYRRAAGAMPLRKAESTKD